MELNIIIQKKQSYSDKSDKFTRIILINEGTSNRSIHIIETKLGPRFLFPIECECLNGFDDNWTEGMPKRARYFTMGNALTVGVIFEIMKNIKEFFRLIYLNLKIIDILVNDIIF